MQPSDNFEDVIAKPIVRKVSTNQSCIKKSHKKVSHYALL